jgi:hypothetical protein
MNIFQEIKSGIMEGTERREREREGYPPRIHEFITNYTNEKYPLTFPPQAGGNRREGDIYCVIANEVKQSHKSKYRLLRRFTPRNNNFGHSETNLTIFHELMQ